MGWVRAPGEVCTVLLLCGLVALSGDGFGLGACLSCGGEWNGCTVPGGGACGVEGRRASVWDFFFFVSVRRDDACGRDGQEQSICSTDRRPSYEADSSLH